MAGANVEPCLHIEAYESHHAAEPDLLDKGLARDAVGLFGSAMIATSVLLVAYAYRALNRVAPDAGTSFAWTVEAFGPHIGSMCGWGLVLATIIMRSNLAGVAVTVFYKALPDRFSRRSTRRIASRATRRSWPASGPRSSMR
ncbi:MAG TPA: hypothetical protein VN213_12010 [Solirubrobacteraceae bacterium]|nr:hypothetical protein [Solirubrobacteraceae bacterium]